MPNVIEANGRYSTKNQWYPGDKYRAVNYDGNDKLMDLVEFVEYLKQEKKKYDEASDSAKATASAFRADAEGVFCIYVTVFVDEYYYETHPLNANVQTQDLWKQFVNKPNRFPRKKYEKGRKFRKKSRPGFSAGAALSRLDRHHH